MERFDIVEFKREGLASTILGAVLKVFCPSWDGWGWHLAIAWEKAYDGWIIFESTGSGVGLNLHYQKELSKKTRCYGWLDCLDEKKMNESYQNHIGKKYDVAVYFWTAAQYLFRHFWNRRIPRLLDDRFTCWELVSEFCEEMGKPIESKYDCPMLPDILQNIKGTLRK
jgi:hypothetical protein